ncbi:MAG: hypothetical protein LBP59_11425 [Planctomycetaceae bacterium]|nr:hypothetical protein [Planctomycetaceae bacterium]
MKKIKTTSKKLVFIQIVFEFHRFKSVKACRPKTRQAKVNENSSANSLEILFRIFVRLQKIIFWSKDQSFVVSIYFL